MNKEMFDRGLDIRKKVLGAEFVEKSFAAADEFNMPMQELTTEYCWGAIWGRDGLSHKTRSMLNLAMLSCLNRPHELKMHVKGALKNGVSKDEIREVFLQVAIYAGIPAGVEFFPDCARGVCRSREERLISSRSRSGHDAGYPALADCVADAGPGFKIPEQGGCGSH